MKLKATDKLLEIWDNYRMNYYRWRLLTTRDLIEKELLRIRQYKRRLKRIKKLYEE